jgi:probable O-glycosylation ligase (exosortase A-associated)
MRDLILLIIILASVPLSFLEPYYGILVWTWIAYFNPHRLTFSYMYNFPVAAAIAIPTMAGFIFTKKLNRNFLTLETGLLCMLWVWFVITYLNATTVPLFQPHILLAKAELIRVSKILLMTLLMVLLVTSRIKLKYLMLVTALSFAVLAIKGAAFGLRTGGDSRVWGPPDSFLADNNAFALAINMSLPMLFYLARVEKNRVLRRILNIAFVSGIITVILTYSRGGFLGLAAVLGLIAVKSRYRIFSAFLIAVCAFLVLTFVPQQWMNRMGTIDPDNLDMSARQRLVSWGTTWNFVHDYPIFGGSFHSLMNPDLFQRYESEPLPGGFLSSGPHSIYFQELGEQGFPGLALYLTMVGCCIVTLRRLRARARHIPSAQWVTPYSHMLEVAIVAFLISGAFLGFADFDLFFQMVACTSILKSLFRRELAIQESIQFEHVPTLAESGAI